MSNAQKMMLLAAGLFLTVGLITIAVMVFGSAQGVSQQAQDSFAGIQEELAYTEFAQFDGETVSGSTVVNTLRKYKSSEKLAIQVKTGGNTGGTWYGNTATMTADVVTAITPSATKFPAGVKTETAGTYVNPNGKFGASIYYDQNRAVRAIVFTQK